MMVELAVLQRFAPQVIAARGHLAEEQQGPQRALLAWGVSMGLPCDADEPLLGQGL